MTAVDWRQVCADVLSDVFEERENQVAQFGEAHEAALLDGTGPEVRWLAHAVGGDLEFSTATQLEASFRREYESFEADHGKIDWMHLVREEVGEAFKESSPDELETELIQVAALCVAWIAQIRLRQD